MAGDLVLMVTYLCLEALLCGLGVAVRWHLRVVARVLLPIGAAAHHLEHGGAAGAEEPYDECCGQQQEDDVEDDPADGKQAEDGAEPRAAPGEPRRHAEDENGDEQGDEKPRERGPMRLDPEHAVPEGDIGAHRFRRSQRHHLGRRKGAFGQNAQHLAADIPGRADHCDLVRHDIIPLGPVRNARAGAAHT